MNNEMFELHIYVTQTFRYSYNLSDPKIGNNESIGSGITLEASSKWRPSAAKSRPPSGAPGLRAYWGNL